jgi:hypothetical protein
MGRTRALGALLGVVALLLGSLGPAALLVDAADHAGPSRLDAWVHGHEHPAGVPDHDHPSGERLAATGAGPRAPHFVAHATPAAMPPVAARRARHARGDAFQIA